MNSGSGNLVAPPGGASPGVSGEWDAICMSDGSFVKSDPCGEDAGFRRTVATGDVTLTYPQVEPGDACCQGLAVSIKWGHALIRPLRHGLGVPVSVLLYT